MANAVITGTASTTAAATGNSTQGRLFWAANQAAWWIIYDGPGSSQISAKYSGNGTSWTAPTGSPLTAVSSTTADARDLGFHYANISGYDVCASAFGNSGGYLGRLALGTTWSGTYYTLAAGGASPNGCCALYNSNNQPWMAFNSYGTNLKWAYSPNADAGSSWTPGTLFVTNDPISQSFENIFFYVCNLATSGNVLFIFGDGSGAGVHTNLQWAIWNGSSMGTPANIFSAFTSTADVNVGACQISTSDTHVVALTSGGNTFSHSRFNGTSFSAGNTLPTLTLATNSGIALIPDGAGNVYAWAIDSSGNVSYCKWTGATPAWAGSWTVLEARSGKTPTYVTCAVNAAGTAIQVAWTETNGANYEIWTSNLGLAAGSTAALFAPATLSLGSGGPFFQTSVNG